MLGEGVGGGEGVEREEEEKGGGGRGEWEVVGRRGGRRGESGWVFVEGSMVFDFFSPI